ncbi:hypothetical protein H4S07_001005 [Coemansia furcata]|uniref:Uncharacterized protein n=1 Tax=Coemansia furcata TaxID=417177 RepID=A0ACC1LPW8_9FUNG|nr:hypothetical protein H4S07_001005 [Coemansia furcata]
MISDNEQPSAALDDAGGFNLASSSLFGAQHNCAAPVDDLPDSGLNRPRASVRFDPLAQLLGSSDTEEDTTDAVGDSDSEIGDKENSPVSRPSLPLASAHADVLAAQITTTTDEEDEEPVTPRRRPFTAARFALNKGDSIVARLASRRGRAVSDSSSDEDAAALQFDGPRQRTMSSLRIDSDSDEPLAPMAASPPPPTAAPAKVKKPRAPRKMAPAEDGVPKERPASKAAMAKIHQETERLVRETAVLINPLDYTQRLVLDDFFARFDLYASNASDPAATAVEPTPKLASLPQHTFHYESDSGDYEVEIVDDDITPAMGRVGILSLIKSPAATSSFKPRGSATDLDSILDYASQPLRSSAPTSSAMRPPTDGPMGLKQLNGALMRAMYKQDEEALRAAITASTAVEPVDESGEREGAGDSGESECDAGVKSDSDSELEDIDSILRPRLKRRPAPVISDDDDDDDEPVARPPSVTAQKPLPPPTAIASSDRGKKFLGMFKMPAAKPKAKPLVAPVEPTPPEPSPPENPMSASQDVPYLFSSQLGCVGDTQDSLLMTPAEDVTNRQFDSLEDTQMGMMGHLEQFPDYQETQPTQMMADDDDEEVGRIQLAQNSQPTQLTMATDSDAGQDDSILPTMVRRALVSGGDDSDASAEEEEDDGEEDEDEEDGDSDIEEKIGGSMSPQPMAPAGRLLRKGDIVAQRKQKRRDAKRSEFVEAEAEEGDSSDSDGVSKGAGPRKFNWGDGPAPKPAGVSEDEEEYDMDSDEEEAALLADPMINNEVDENASEGDEAIRELHRQRDFDDDERNIQTLYNDITTGALKNRVSRNRTGFALADDEDYNDRQTRAERMEERERMRRRLLAREIHDKDLAEIAKNPETAAFARAALMRPPGAAVDDEEMLMLPGDDAFELEEIVDDRHVAAAVQQQLMRTRMRVESDDEDGAPKPAAARIAGSSQLSSLTDSVEDMDDGTFSAVAVEKLIVRRRTLLASGKDGVASSLHRTSSLLKRPGTSLLGAAAKRLNVAGEKKVI